jgi:hypothetical protein
MKPLPQAAAAPANGRQGFEHTAGALLSAWSKDGGTNALRVVEVQRVCKLGDLPHFS